MVGAYSRWVPIRRWVVVNRVNTVFPCVTLKKCSTQISLRIVANIIASLSLANYHELSWVRKQRTRESATDPAKISFFVSIH